MPGRKGGHLFFRIVWWSSVALFILGLSLASTVEAQERGWSWDLHAGFTFPAGTLDDYFDAGPTVGANVTYPLRDRLDLTFSVDLDLIGGHRFYGTPDLNLFRYQVGVLADLLGEQFALWTLEVRARAGAATFRNRRIFWVEAATTGQPVPTPEDLEPRSFAKTSGTGSAGLRIRFGGDSKLNGFLAADGNWSAMGEDDTEVLRLTEPDQLDPLSSALSYSLTAGFRYTPGG